MAPSMVMGCSLIAPRDVTSIQCGDGPQMNTCVNKENNSLIQRMTWTLEAGDGILK